MSVVGLATATASASQWNLTYNGYGSSTLANVSYNANQAWNGAPAGSFSQIRVGEHLFQTGSLAYATFCIQLFEGLTVGATTAFCEVDVALVPEGPPSPGPMGLVKATLVQDLYYRFYASTNDETATAAELDVRNAAFQIALYEVTHESLSAADAAGAAGQLGLGQGAFQSAGRSGDAASALAVSLAADMLAALGDGGFNFFGTGLRGLTNDDRQDQLIVVPLPTTVALAAAGLGLVGVARRRARTAR
ncbi:MAG: hypothetical protein SGJ11_01000 [Phycisphaerae bacterium]|nr:hypothetical protein [Phycisphaerae bacterium]